MEHKPHVVDNISHQNDLVEEFYSKMASQGNFDNVQRKPSGRTKEQRPEDDEKRPKTTKISESARYGCYVCIVLYSHVVVELRGVDVNLVMILYNIFLYSTDQY